MEFSWAGEGHNSTVNDDRRVEDGTSPTTNDAGDVWRTGELNCNTLAVRVCMFSIYSNPVVTGSSHPKG